MSPILFVYQVHGYKRAKIKVGLAIGGEIITGLDFMVKSSEYLQVSPIRAFGRDTDGFLQRTRETVEES